MACPECGCQVTYSYDDGDIVSMSELDQCAACGEIFDAEMSVDDEPITEQWDRDENWIESPEMGAE
jgi:transcription initiation factor TFIIIB Brf1 subunit/transcription initiation factor TFIIB